MALYVIQARGADQASLEQALVVKDGFCWPAFFFSGIWLLYHRLWLAFALWLAVEIGFAVLIGTHVTAGTDLLVGFLIHLFLGLEGNHIRLAMDQRRAALVEIIESRDQDEAETRFFDRALSRRIALTTEPAA